MIKATYEDHMGDDLRVVNAARVSFGKRSEWELVPPPRPKIKVGEQVEYVNSMDWGPNKGTIGTIESVSKHHFHVSVGSGSFWTNEQDVKVPGATEQTTKRLKDSDARLIQFLARGCESREWDEAISNLWDGDTESIERTLKWAKSMPTHWTPFGHTAITLIEEIPIFVARQRFKHTIGFVYNEISRRYVTDEPDFYQPELLRKASANKKQGSSDEVFYDEESAYLKGLIRRSVGEALAAYENMLDCGVCAEQARMVLPQSMMTTYWVTGNLYSFAQAYKARSRPDAQKEIRDLAAEWDRIIRPLFPVSWSALVD